MLRNLVAWVRANHYRFGAIGVAFTLVWLWVTLVLLVMNLYVLKTQVGSDFVKMLYDDHLPLGLRSLFADASPTESFLWMLFGSCVMAPLVEEAFRAAVCQLCTDEATGKAKYHFVLWALSFLGFGLLHGGGYFSIFIQGSLGLLLSWLWFRTLPGPDGKTVLRKEDGEMRIPWWPFLANVFVHAAYNFCVTGVQVMIVRSHM